MQFFAELIVHLSRQVQQLLGTATVPTAELQSRHRNKPAEEETRQASQLQVLG